MISMDIVLIYLIWNVYHNKKFFILKFLNYPKKMMIDNQNIMTNEIANSMVTNTLLTSMKTFLVDHPFIFSRFENLFRIHLNNLTC